MGLKSLGKFFFFLGKQNAKPFRMFAAKDLNPSLTFCFESPLHLKPTSLLLAQWNAKIGVTINWTKRGRAYMSYFVHILRKTMAPACTWRRRQWYNCLCTHLTRFFFVLTLVRCRWVQCSFFHKEGSGRENIGTWRQGITEILDGRFWCLSRYTESSFSSLIFAALVDPVCKQISLWTLWVSKYPCICKQRSMHLSPRARHAWLYLNLTRLCFSTGLFGCWFASSRFPSFLPVLIHHRLPHRARPSSHPISFLLRLCSCIPSLSLVLSLLPVMTSHIKCVWM